MTKDDEKARYKCCATCKHCISEDDDMYFCDTDYCSLSYWELVGVYCQHWELRTEPADEYEMQNTGMKKRG